MILFSYKYRNAKERTHGSALRGNTATTTTKHPTQRRTLRFYVRKNELETPLSLSLSLSMSVRFFVHAIYLSRTLSCSLSLSLAHTLTHTWNAVGEIKTTQCLLLANFKIFSRFFWMTHILKSLSSLFCNTFFCSCEWGNCSKVCPLHAPGLTLSEILGYSMIISWYQATWWKDRQNQNFEQNVEQKCDVNLSENFLTVFQSQP